jgi:hypothetical protein
MTKAGAIVDGVTVALQAPNFLVCQTLRVVEDSKKCIMAPKKVLRWKLRRWTPVLSCAIATGLKKSGNEGDSTLPRRLFLCGIVILGNEGDSTLPLRLFFRGIVMLMMSYLIY